MRYRTNMAVLLGALALAAIAAPGCGSGTTATSDNGGAAGDAGSAGSKGGSAGSGGTTAGAGGATGGASGSTTGGSAGSAGSNASGDVGHPGADFVNAGGVAKSANYKMVFTLGQSTQNQGTTTSANYRMHGGLIGATGSGK